MALQIIWAMDQQFMILWTSGTSNYASGYASGTLIHITKAF